MCASCTCIGAPHPPRSQSALSCVRVTHYGLNKQMACPQRWYNFLGGRSCETKCHLSTHGENAISCSHSRKQKPTLPLCIVHHDWFIPPPGFPSYQTILGCESCHYINQNGKCTGCTENDRHPELIFFLNLFWGKIGRILWNMLKCVMNDLIGSGQVWILWLSSDQNMWKSLEYADIPVHRPLFFSQKGRKCRNMN